MQLVRRNKRKAFGIGIRTEEESEMANYRELWFQNNESNHGWYTCVRCGKNFRKKDIDIDHIIPQNRGGKDNLNNLQCMCRHCNRSKQDDLNFTTVTDYARNVVRNTKKDMKKGLKRAIGKIG